MVSRKKEPTAPKRVRFKYVFPDDYNTLYVNGAYGGVSPRGELVMNFYLERQPVPRWHENELGESGGIGEELSSEPPKDLLIIIRYIQAGVVMNLENARSVRDWLSSHIASLEAMRPPQNLIDQSAAADGAVKKGEVDGD
jgi:hypothetical protein